MMFIPIMDQTVFIACGSIQSNFISAFDQLKNMVIQLLWLISHSLQNTVRSISYMFIVGLYNFYMCVCIGVYVCMYVIFICFLSCDFYNCHRPICVLLLLAYKKNIIIPELSINWYYMYTSGVIHQKYFNFSWHIKTSLGYYVETMTYFLSLIQ